MSRLTVGREELRKAFRRHREAAQQCRGPSSLLLKFYAVECGLKYKYLKDQGCYSSDKLKGEFGADGHDLSAGIRLCRVPATVCSRPEDPRTPMDPPSLHPDKGGDRIPARQAHQAWRYGTAIRSKDNETYNAWLDKIAAWLHEEIR